MKAEDNPFPYVTLVEGAAPAAPSAGRQREFIDSADHKVKRINSSGTVTTIEGGGSGGSTIKDLRWTPASGDTTIDEFNDSSLAGAWVRVDGANAPSGNVTWVEGADVVSGFSSGSDSGGAMHGLMIPLSGFGGSLATGDAVVTCMTLDGPYATNYVIGALCVATGVTYGAGDQLVNELTCAASPLTTNYFIDKTNWTTEGTATSNGNPMMPRPWFLRIVNLGSNVWRGDRSIDGVQWTIGATKTWAKTPTHAGFNVRQPGTTNKITASFDFLRRVSGVS